MLDTKAIKDLLAAQLAANDSYQLSENDHLEFLSELETIGRLLAAVKTDADTQADERVLHSTYGCKDLAMLLCTKLQIHPGEAKRRTRLVRELPTLPHTREAMYAGEISGEHALVISDAIKRLPSEHVEGAERVLADVAPTLDPEFLMRAGKYVRTVVDPDGVYRDEREAIERRAARMSRGKDGSLRFQVTVDALNGEKIRNLFLAMAKPRSVDGEKDPRTFEQRLADAFIEAMTIAMAHHDIPGLPRSLLVMTMNADNLKDKTGCARTDTGQPVSPDLAQHVACDADIAHIVLGEKGEPLAYGRGRRLASLAQRRALAVRDKGCAFPGCDRPPSWTEAHHVVHWIDGGPTDLDNLVLLCVYHHHVIHAQDWEIIFDHGMPSFIPPQWIDPDQVPLRNIRVDCPLTL
ncbi:HNH endonuclease [Allokutzneria sp. A3M-2-11 16]|uniref:HNH endonuclease signature motif containing protein n=1 Tax=Allokutzneria sp. A3M-2-11 16 TaxID=2962043 RepID=UPI0020B8B974|nr:HNH endonuclease signature motif containing protein [Allokutzneria sp. A3M-2-11 16]MCP3801520.1 HNH endonuclease [Allokutzneria sp. A3M-2-11 16]